MSKFIKILLWIMMIDTGIICLISLITIPLYFIERGVLEGVTALVRLALLSFWEMVYIYVLWFDKKAESEEI